MKNNKTFLILLILAIPFGLIATSGCDQVEKLNSRIQCAKYCDKKADCAIDGDTIESKDVCVADCRQSIEDNCGNENRDEVNQLIDECVDKSCVDFAICMVFEVAPECLGFVNP